MGKQRTRELMAGAQASPDEKIDRVIKIFSDHVRLAAKGMKPSAALHTGYTAAANFLAQDVEGKRNRDGSAVKGGVKGGS